MVQDILSELESDEVNAITDTTEAQQVAKIIRATYFSMFSRANLPEHHKIFNLTASGSASQPVLMTRPSNVGAIDWIKYNTSDDAALDPTYREIDIVSIEDFVKEMHDLNLTETTVDSMTVNSQTFYYRNDVAPTKCAIFQEDNIIFDSFDLAEETTLQASKTFCQGLIMPTFTMSDSFVPDIDENQFPLLLNEATARAFVSLKQMPNQKAEQEARRQWVSLQKNKHMKPMSDFEKLPYFGRR